MKLSMVERWNNFVFIAALIQLTLSDRRTVSGFATRTQGLASRMSPQVSDKRCCKCQQLLQMQSVGDRFFQLEEMEDQDTCTTELYLAGDKTVSVGETNGPVFMEASGNWEQYSDGRFEMVLRRTYVAGKERTHLTDMGEFKFQVERTFLGTITTVGESMALAGSMHHFDIIGDKEVGFFSMIDTTKEKLRQD